MPEKPKVVIYLLTGTERTQWINPELTKMIFQMGRDQRFDVQLETIKDARPVEVARNVGVALARDRGFDWIVQIDNDNFLLSPQTPLDIIASNRHYDVIGCRYGVGKRETGYGLYPPQGQNPIVEMGGGVLMIRSTVWQKIPKGPWFKWEYSDSETLAQQLGNGGCGEDVHFCRLALKHGLTIGVSDVLAGHYKTTDATALVMTMDRLKAQSAPMRPTAQPSRWVTQRH